MSVETKTKWHALTDTEVKKGLATDFSNGLSASEADLRLERYGLNIFEQEKEKGIVARLFAQLKNPLAIILLIAGLVTIFLSEFIDASVIFIALAINIVVSVIQEGRASKAFEKLSSSQEKYATVLRDGKRKVVPAKNLVPGDVITLEAGSYVPADARIISEKDLSVNEAILTGEWVSVDKEIGVSAPDAHVAKQKNMVFMGTLVASGMGIAVVTATGNDTQVGSIAEGLKDTGEAQTPIQRNVKKLAKFLAGLILVIVLGIFIVGILRGEDIVEMLVLSIAVAVSVIPEGLPAVVTVVLAVGMEKILEKKGLVRNLLAAETLGSTTVILTDKTGTITEAKMKLEDMITVGNHENDKTRALELAVLASDAFVESKGGEEGVVVRGRPMERAIIQGGLVYGASQEKLLKTHTLLDSQPFDSEVRYSASLFQVEGGSREVALSGAPEVILKHAGYILENSKEVPITEEHVRTITKELKEYAQKGSRLIATAYNNYDKKKLKGEEALKRCVFAGLISFNDPVRKDAEESIAKARGAGARIIMLTGDNAITARSIAQEAGVTTSDTVVTGSQMEHMSNKELFKALKETDVFARVLPSQKLRIARILQNKGEVVAMTGDGINDAPALRRANIGIAVGSGSEVAKEASDLVLLNNSFSIIVSAIEEGRRIIDNLKKVVTHLLSTSFHSVFIIIAAIVAAAPLPILAVQILWVNIIEEGLLTFAFAFEPGEPEAMKRDPRSVRMRDIMTSEIRKLILIAGTITGIFSVAIYFFLLNMGLPIEEIRTVMFVVLSLDAIFFAVSLKHLRKPFWHVNIFNNHYLLFALGASIFGILMTLLLPPLRNFLSLSVLNTFEVILLFGVAAFNLLTIEVSKRIVFKGNTS